MNERINLFSLVFLRKLKTPKSYFEINWPFMNQICYYLSKDKAICFYYQISIKTFIEFYCYLFFRTGIFYSDLISRLNIICFVFDKSSRIWQWYFWSHRKSDWKSRWSLFFYLPRTGLVHSYWYILISHLLLDVLVVVVSMIIEIWLGPLFGVTE